MEWIQYNHDLRLKIVENITLLALDNGLGSDASYTIFSTFIRPMHVFMNRNLVHVIPLIVHYYLLKFGFSHVNPIFILITVTGAMLVICDVNEYRKCMKEFKIPMVSDLFEKLHALCNLLVVVPENLKEVCSGESLVCIPCMYN